MIWRSVRSWELPALYSVVGLVLFSADSAADSKADDMKCQPTPDSYYHPKAIRLHESGVVLVEYSVNKKGLTERIVVLESTTSDSLEESAVRFVKKLRCKVSKQWIKDGGPEERSKVNIVFRFTNEEAARPIDPDADVMTITTRGI